MEILRVNDLKTYFYTRKGTVRAVDGVSFSLKQGETLGIVGESGAGKTVLSLSVMGLAGNLGGEVVTGEVWYEGNNLMAKPELYTNIRGRKISLIPQEAAPALNPVFNIGFQLEEMLAVHLGMGKAERRARIEEMLEDAGLPDPALVAGLYPHQLSGGMVQRVLLAFALCCSPDIIIADEPASSLDTTVQAQVLELLRDIKEQRGLSIILIAHDLGVVANNCDRVLVMYRGRILESGPTSTVLTRPLHPYTQSLLRIYRYLEKGMGENNDIRACPPMNCEGTTESMGCVFAYRCERAAEVCYLKNPLIQNPDTERFVSCNYVYL
ncbi:MAG: peptide ABC transporter ATP-binding protein [Firmicutes bacterium HGW-Firmicutes-14]|nr:MAG: peptide ABC transporter ATP-binding protein [Firmicutes bacterium HGW-Firmicutes-14]